MTRTLSLISLAAVAFMGCAAFQIQVLPPGNGVDDNMAISACGSLELFTSLVTEVAYARPRVGQSLCELYASIGAPSNSEVRESADGLDEMELQYRTRGSGVANVQIRDSSATSRGAGGGTSGEQWIFGETDSNYIYHGVRLKQRDGGEFFVSAVGW
jgi:hypothetical protein